MKLIVIWSNLIHFSCNWLNNYKVHYVPLSAAQVNAETKIKKKNIQTNNLIIDQRNLTRFIILAYDIDICSSFNKQFCSFFKGFTSSQYQCCVIFSVDHINIGTIVEQKLQKAYWTCELLVLINSRKYRNRGKPFLPRFAAQVNAVSPSVPAKLTSIWFSISNSATFSNSGQINIGSHKFCINEINVFTVITWVDGDDQCWIIKIVDSINIRSMFEKQLYHIFWACVSFEFSFEC